MYDRHNPCFASLKQIYRLNKEGSCKETYHVVLEADIPYHVGDSAAILPSHDSNIVEKTLKALRALGSEVIEDKRGQEKRSLKDHLTFKANITKVHVNLLKEVAGRTQNVEKRKWLEELASGSHHDSLSAYLHSYEVWDFLEEHCDVGFTAQEIVDILPPLLPRFYSISSSPLFCKNEIHLTVAMTDFVSRGIQRNGVGTHFLCRLLELNKKNVPLYIQHSSGFTLPSSDTPIIMIGPGTGVAPFRAFMQERLATNAKGKSWLFFGERNEKTDFFYKDFWNELEIAGNFRLDVAFSRDQQHKVYVQHKMQENAKDIFLWLQEGAYIYVCGDAHKMAKDVDHCLLSIIKEEGRFSDEEAKGYMKELKKNKRYLRDVY